MMHKIGILATLLLACTMSSAAVSPGGIAGVVRDSSGRPQLGAMVELISSASSKSITVLTDGKGSFSLTGLLPGLYTVRVSAPSFLPTIRESIRVQPGASVLLHMTLSTLFEAIQLVPRQRGATTSDDDWRWALRSMANRPILRLTGNKPLVVVEHGERESDAVLKARVSFLSGGDPDAGGTSSTNFQVERSMFGTVDSRFSLNGGVNSNASSPNAVIRAAYSREMPDGSFPEIAISAKHFATMNPDQPAIQALAISVANTMTFGERLELDYGNESQMVQFRTRATSFRPHATVSYHAGENTTFQYGYTTSVPTLRADKGFDTAPADLSETNPRVTVTPFGGQHVEMDIHHEVSVSQRLGKHKIQVAAYSDRIHNVALNGVGQTYTADSNALIGGPYSGIFTYNGGNLRTEGVRGVYSYSLARGLNATLDYGFGGVLTAPEGLLTVNQTSTSLLNVKRHSAAAKLSGTVPKTRTRVIGSYRWLSGSALTPVDMFNASAGQADPYLSFFLRQPIPASRLLPNGLEALIDVRNLLAQGYRPVLSNDGSTVYLVQGTRVIRAGVSYNF
ncbi:MAG: TonB-dependent receptor [Acidobacteriota bacterium]|nr:TonB-dependent receptor [Acidobacteriota bacterium]